MSIVIPEWVRESAGPWFVVMAVMGVVVLLGVVVLPRLRRRLPIIVPVSLGGSCLAVVALNWHEVARRWPQFFFGEVGSGIPVMILVGVLIAVAGGWAAFQLERALLRRRRVSTFPQAPDPGLPAALQAVDLPARAETMSGVARIASHPGQFAAITGLTVVGEEAMFRGLFLSSAGLVLISTVSVIAFQALLYGMTHLAFGWPSMIGKAVFGIALGAGAWLGGVLVAILAHGIYQVWVYQQFRRR